SKFCAGRFARPLLFVDVLLFSFQGSVGVPPFRLCCSLLLGDFYYIKACLYSCQHFQGSFL
ncbi:hypothetical protein, partial [uncultured Planococcus sp.]|uniref:hypothetical protein n=1 Tax=Planococcus donghaensis TaxID=414778 RepID=UPI0026119A84